VLATTRADGRPQLSPVTGTQGPDGRLLISSYPARAKTRNLRRDPACSVLVLSEEFNGAWLQLDGTAEVLDGEAGVEALVEYYRAAAGEHPDWDEYRQAMRDRDKVAIAITVTRWGPVATGGVPPEFADD
jgi:PPOX class probable F420-dependent enzyme